MGVLLIEKRFGLNPFDRLLEEEFRLDAEGFSDGSHVLGDPGRRDIGLPLDFTCAIQLLTPYASDDLLGIRATPCIS